MALVSALDGYPPLNTDSAALLIRGFFDRCFGGLEDDAAYFFLLIRRAELRVPGRSDDIYLKLKIGKGDKSLKRFMRRGSSKRSLGDSQETTNHRLVEKSDIENLIGETLESYPATTYTSQVVNAWSRGERPVRHRCDPFNIDACLLDALVLEKEASFCGTNGDATDERRRRYSLMVGAVALAGKALLVESLYRQMMHETPKDVVQLNFPALSDEAKNSLDCILDTEYSKDRGIGELYRVFSSLDTIRKRSNRIVADAVEGALLEVRYLYRLKLRSAVRKRNWIPARLALSTAEANAYLNTIQWQASGKKYPNEISLERSSEIKDLASIFWDDEVSGQAQLHWGKDLDGRRVAYNRESATLAVSWPAYLTLPDWDVDFKNIDWEDAASFIPEFFQPLPSTISPMPFLLDL